MSFSTRLETGFGQLGKWSRRGILFAAGGLASLSLPPLSLWVCLFLSFPVLYLALTPVPTRAGDLPRRAGWKETIRHSFSTAWWFGFGFFSLSLYWVGASLLVEPDKFAIFLPLAVFALPAGLALFWGFGCAAVVFFSQPGLSRVLGLCLGLGLAEWLRGHVLTGFPWNLIGFASFSLGETRQLAAFVGIYGLTLVVLLWALAPVLLIGRHRHFSGFALIVLSLATGLFLGQQLVSQPGRSHQPETAIRIVQPNIAQKKKWDRRFRGENIDQLFALSSKAPKNPTRKPSVVIWPESALPLLYQASRMLQKRVDRLLDSGQVLIMGAIRRGKAKSAANSSAHYFNSVLVVSDKGDVINQFDKFHLVPFGEYMPAENWLKQLGLRAIVTLPGGFSTGPGPKTLRVNGLPGFSPLICYEIIFSGDVLDRQDRAAWLVNVTNDGWFGKTAGPYQHLAQAQMRAIETGLPVIRAANTGISAVIDPHGKIISSLPLNSAGVLDALLPEPLDETVFSRWAPYAFWLVFLCVLIIFFFASDVLRRGRSAR